MKSTYVYSKASPYKNAPLSSRTTFLSVASVTKGAVPTSSAESAVPETAKKFPLAISVLLLSYTSGANTENAKSRFSNWNPIAGKRPIDSTPAKPLASSPERINPTASAVCVEPGTRKSKPATLLDSRMKSPSA